MNTLIPSAAQVRAALVPLNHSQLHVLAASSGVPYHTLLKVRSGETENPRIETVRLFLPLLADIQAAV